MRRGWLTLVAVGCSGEDPLTEAWHRAIELERVEQAEGACDADWAEVEPAAPWLFLATSMGAPDVASLYSCSGPEVCEPTPLASVWVERWTERRLAGSLATSFPLGTSCTVAWDRIDATRTEAGEVELTWHTFQGSAQASDALDCDALAGALMDHQCDLVVRYRGVQAE